MSLVVPAASLADRRDLRLVWLRGGSRWCRSSLAGRRRIIIGRGIVIVTRCRISRRCGGGARRGPHCYSGCDTGTDTRCYNGCPTVINTPAIDRSAVIGRTVGRPAIGAAGSSAAIRASDGSPAVGAASRPGIWTPVSCATLGADYRGTAHRALISCAAIGPVNGSPTDRFRRRQSCQAETEANNGQPFHGWRPLVLAGVAAVASGLSCTSTAPAGG
jgi:hypothetical protein